jgi:hypothetical protein
MLIMSDVELIEKVPLGLANFLVGPLSLGIQRTTEVEYVTAVVVVRNYFGCGKLSKTMVTL